VISVAVAGLAAPAMSALMMSRAAIMGFTGRSMKSLFDGISGGVVIVLQTMVLNGTVVGCAVGGGVGRFMGISQGTLKALLRAEFTSRSIIGRDSSKLADIISFGVVNHLKTSVSFTVTAAGAIAPVAPVGPVAVVSIPSVTTSII